MQETLLIRKGIAAESDKVISLLKQTAQWLKENNIDQWQYLLAGGDDEEIENAIRDNQTYIVLREKEIIATFTLSSKQTEWDQHIFGIDEMGDSLYLHRLAILPDYMGKGLGGDILQWICAQDTQKNFLRLDCVAKNKQLNQFYLNNDFEYLGETDFHSKYQKRIK